MEFNLSERISKNFLSDTEVNKIDNQSLINIEFKEDDTEKAQNKIDQIEECQYIALYNSQNKRKFVNDCLRKFSNDKIIKINCENKKIEYFLSLFWGIENYHFNFFKNDKKDENHISARLVTKEKYLSILRHFYLLRDLVNLPANYLFPASFASIIKDEINYLGEKFDKNDNLSLNIISDINVLKNEFPLIYNVGKASVNQPMLVEVKYKPNKINPKAKKLSLIGKGVCFDTGGLNIKKDMLLMKKDMGGAAHAFSLFQILVQNNYENEIQLLLPIVENNIDGNALRPSDIIVSRKSTSVEITNTDAEGRLVLADAIDYAKDFKADYVITLATLTGAARIALGPSIVPFYGTNALIANEIEKLSFNLEDYLWHMPLFAQYKSFLHSDVADINNCAHTPMAGSMTAALFLYEFFANKDKQSDAEFFHFDLYSWANNRNYFPNGACDQSLLTLSEYFLQKT